MLAQIDSIPGVRGSWVDHAGKYLKVTGANENDLNAVLQEKGFKAVRIAESEVKDEKWFNSADTLVLSIEEAGELSSGWVKQSQQAAGLTDDEVKALSTALKEEIISGFKKFHDGKLKPGKEEWQQEFRLAAERAIGKKFSEEPEDRRAGIKKALLETVLK